LTFHAYFTPRDGYHDNRGAVNQKVISGLLTSVLAYATLSAVTIMNTKTHFAQLQGLLLGVLLAGIAVPARHA
jgi:hypothetical protein